MWSVDTPWFDVDGWTGEPRDRYLALARRATLRDLFRRVRLEGDGR